MWFKTDLQKYNFNFVKISFDLRLDCSDPLKNFPSD